MREDSPFWAGTRHKCVCDFRFVVWGLEEEWSQYLQDLREVGVLRLAVYQLKFIECVGKFCHNLFGCHFVCSMWLCWEQFGPLQLQVP